MTAAEHTPRGPTDGPQRGSHPVRDSPFHIIDRVAQADHRFQISGNVEITREEQGVPIPLAFDQPEEITKPPSYPRVAGRLGLA